MKNKDMPAMPTKHDNEHFQSSSTYTTGLTKREHFAAMAMQGFLSNRIEVPSTGGKRLEDFIAKCSIDYADALLKALEEQQ